MGSAIWGLALGVAIGSAERRNREAMAAAVGAAVAAAANPPHIMTQDEINAYNDRAKRAREAIHPLPPRGAPDYWQRYFHQDSPDDLLAYFEKHPDLLRYIPKAERKAYSRQLKERGEARRLGRPIPSFNA